MSTMIRIVRPGGSNAYAISRRCRRTLQHSHSFSTSPETNKSSPAAAEKGNQKTDTITNESTTLQSLILSRRTISNFKVDEDTNLGRLRSSIERAVRCGQNAPNHKRTEPFSFRLLMSEESRNHLADICREVNVQKMRVNQKGSEASIQAEADRKRDRWSKIPAYLVALVKGAPLDRSSLDGQDKFYPPLPYQYPLSIRQMEDYGSVCAATQNVLLSLHSDGFGTKWATGPVIESLAFRELVKCGDDELAVALIMIGEPKRIPRPPRRRRTIEGDLLMEL